MKASVCVENLAGGKIQIAADCGEDAGRDIRGLPHAGNRGEASFDQCLIPVLDACGHVRLDDSRAHLKDWPLRYSILPGLPKMYRRIRKQC